MSASSLDGLGSTTTLRPRRCAGSVSAEFLVGSIPVSRVDGSRVDHLAASRALQLAAVAASSSSWLQASAYAAASALSVCCRSRSPERIRRETSPGPAESRSRCRQRVAAWPRCRGWRGAAAAPRRRAGRDRGVARAAVGRVGWVPRRKGGTPHRLSKGLSCSIPVGDRWATGEMSSRRLASLALIAHGQPRPSTRFAAPPLPCGPAGDRRDRPCTHRLRASQGRLALNSTAGATTASPSVVARQVFERTAVSRSRGHSLGTVRVEAGSIAEHRAGDVEQAVGHRTQGTGVSVAAGAQSAVLAVAHRITLGSNPSPVEGSLTQPVMGGETARHDHAPAGPAGDRRHAAEAAQRGVVQGARSRRRWCGPRTRLRRLCRGRGRAAAAPTVRSAAVHPLGRGPGGRPLGAAAGSRGAGVSAATSSVPALPGRTSDYAGLPSARPTR